MATTRTQSQIQTDLNNAKNTYIGGCAYKNESTISYSNISHYGLELTSASWRDISGPDNPYNVIKPSGPKITKRGMNMQDSKIKLYCKSCGRSGSKEHTPVAYSSGDYISRGIFLQSDWNGNRLKASLSTINIRNMGSKPGLIFLPGYRYSSGWTSRMTSTNSSFGIYGTGTSMESTTFGNISHDQGSVDSSAVSRYQTELNQAVARDNACTSFDNLYNTISGDISSVTSSNLSTLNSHLSTISSNSSTSDSRYTTRKAKYDTLSNKKNALDAAIIAFDNLNLNTTPNNTTAAEAKRQLDIILINAGSSYSGYTSRLATYNTYVANLSTTEQLNISVGSLRELHTNISGTMLPGKVSRYTDIHTRGTEEYNATKSCIEKLLNRN